MVPTPLGVLMVQLFWVVGQGDLEGRKQSSTPVLLDDHAPKPVLDVELAEHDVTVFHRG